MGVSPFTLHDLRRTMATWLGRQKEDFRVIERMLNHRKKTLHFTYNQARYDDDARDAWQRWGAYLEHLSAQQSTRPHTGFTLSAAKDCSQIAADE